MNDELEKLWPKVRDALAEVQGEADCRCSEPYKSRGMKDPQCNHDLQDSVDVIRAELLRLADECAMIPRAQLLANFAAANERAEKAEADLAIAQNTIDAQQDTMGALKRKLALSEGELAALKAKIEAAPLTTFRRAMLGTPHAWVEEKFACPEWIGKRVRLLVED